MEHSHMGARWKARLQELEKGNIEVRSTTKQRALASAQAFLSGYLRKNDTEADIINHDVEDFPRISEDNELLRFYDNCPKYQEEVKNGNRTMEERDKFLKSNHFANLIERVFTRTGVPFNISDISLIWQICRYLFHFFIPKV